MKKVSGPKLSVHDEVSKVRVLPPVQGGKQGVGFKPKVGGSNLSSKSPIPSKSHCKNPGYGKV